MELTYDSTVDALSFELMPGASVAKTLEWASGVYIDTDARGRVLGVEVLGASKHFEANVLTGLQAPVTQMTLAEAAVESGLSPGTLRVLLNKGRLAGQKRGRDWQVSLAALYTYLESRAPAGRPAKKRRTRRSVR